MAARRLPRWTEVGPLLRPRTALRDPVGRRLAAAASIPDLRRLARRRAPRAVFDYTDGAAGAELALRRSHEAYARVEFRPQVLQDVSTVDTSTTILGSLSSLPLVFAPTGFTRMMHTEGESAVARVAARVGIPYALSTMGTTRSRDSPLRRRAPAVVPAVPVARPRREPRLRRACAGRGVRGPGAHRRHARSGSPAPRRATASPSSGSRRGLSVRERCTRRGGSTS